MVAGFAGHVFLCLAIHISWAYDPYYNQPRLESRNGHLLIIGASGSNISLQTSGGGQININDANVFDVLRLAQQAVTKIEKWAYKNAGREDIEAIDRLLTPLSRRLEAVEQMMFNTSSISSEGRFRERLSLVEDNTRRLARSMRVLRRFAEINECTSSPCQHGGTCQDLFKGFQCICPEQWEGAMCQNDVDECLKLKNTDLGCQNGAICENQPGSYKCICADGWYGLHCTRQTRDCASAGSANLCGHGICTDRSVGKVTSYVCVCDQGWKIDENSGGACTVDVDECSASVYPCSHDPLVKCDNFPGGFRCGSCPAGYVGNGYQCRDIDECAIDNGGCSTNPTVQCINTRGSRSCGPCPPGYSGNGVTCERTENLCLGNQGGCHPAARCIHNPGLTYVQCVCPPGWSGSGIGENGCVKDNRTLSICPPSYCLNGGTCDRSRQGDIICMCPPSYSGSRCETELSACVGQPCENGGHCVSVNPLFGTFRCVCEAGFTGDKCQYSLLGCGGMIRSENGSFSWPWSNLTDLRPPNYGFSCHWIISTPSDKVLNITIEYNISCAWNFLRIHDGRNSEYPATSLCGYKAVKNFTSTRKIILLIYESQYDLVGNSFLKFTRKFQINWTSVPRTCGGDINVSKHGTLSSPGSPGYYPQDSHCVWHLQAPLGKRIQISFFSMQIESHPNCVHDYLKIYDGPDITSPHLAVLCNHTIPPPITTSSFNATLEFKTDNTISGKGFQLSYAAVEGIPGCGGVFNLPFGRITPPQSHKSDGSYASALRCEWQIRLPARDRIKLEFSQFKLEEHSSCEFDYLEVYDGPDTNAKKLGRWCGGENPHPLVSTENSLTVIFGTDESYNEGNFLLDYSVVCNSELTSLNGSFSSPNYPNHYPSDRECLYLISVPIGNAITLQFLDIDMEHLDSMDECIYDAITVYDGDTNSSPILDTFCGNRSGIPIISSHNYLLVSFKSDVSEGGRGFLANYSTTPIHCGGIFKAESGNIRSMEEVDLNSYCRWIISAPAGKVVELSWSSFSLETSMMCLQDNVKIYEGSAIPESAHQLGETYCGSNKPPTMTSSSNIVMIVMKTSNYRLVQPSFSVFYRTRSIEESCGGNYHSINGQIKSPNFPKRLSGDLNCMWTINVPSNKQIKLHFDSFKVAGHPPCVHNYLEIRNGGTPTSPLIGTYCGNSFEEKIVSFGNQLHLKFVADSIVSNQGFSLTWDGTTTGCGGEIDGYSGSITSPNYPLPYGRDAECFWLIRVSQGSSVSLTIVDIDLEHHTKCLLDFIDIFDGKNEQSPLLGRYCSESHPLVITSSRNLLYIKFRSDVSRQGRGFHLKFTTVCNHTITGYKGVIESPLFPSTFTMPVDCLWTIQVPLGNAIVVLFSHLTTVSNKILQNVCSNVELPKYAFCEEVNSCNDTYVEVTEGSSSGRKSLGRFCGNKIPSMINSTINEIQVVMKMGSSYSETQFRLEWFVSGCGGDVKVDGTTYIASPDYPSFTSHPTICEWTLTASLGYSIAVNVWTLELDPSVHNCENNYLQVFGGPDTSSPLLTKLCTSSNTLDIVHTSGNKAAVKLHFLDKGKFRFTATVEDMFSKCGGISSAPSGDIYSSNYPQNYDAYDDCSYEINVSEHSRINLTFVDLDIDAAYSNCSDSYVEVFDGRFGASVVHRFCGSVIPKPIISKTNILTVHHNAGNRVAKGFHVTYAELCGGVFSTNDSGVLSYNEKYTDRNCSWVIRSSTLDESITLIFTTLSLVPESAGARLEIYSGEDEFAPKAYVLRGDSLPSSLEIPGSAVMIRLVTGSKKLHASFELLYTLQASACGGSIVAEKGVISSPKYPNDYPPNIECRWTIANFPGNTLIFEIHVLKIASSPYCNENYLEIRRLEDDSLIGTYCGNTAPNRIHTNSSLWVKFRSSRGIDKGFSASFGFESFNEIRGSSGNIQSFSYPGQAIRNANQEWRIVVAVGSIVNINFNDVFFHGTRESCLDRLTIYDGFDASTPILTKLCGFGETAEVEPIHSSSNVVYIVYHALTHPAMFSLSWEQSQRVLKTIIKQSNHTEFISVPTDKPVTIRSAGFPNGYERNLLHDWIITTEDHSHLMVKFDVVDLETLSRRCMGDKVIVYDQNEKGEWSSLGEVCRQNDTEMTFSGSKAMKLTFRTDYSGNRTGFAATARSVCGGRLTDPDGIIKLNRLTSDEITCTWNISVKPGKRIEITFLNFSFTDEDQHSSDMCSSNYVILKEGFELDAPIIGGKRFCGSQAPNKTILTNGNRLSIVTSNSLLGGHQVLELQYLTYSNLCTQSVYLSKKSLTSLIITSPNYPNMPPANSECTWQFLAPTGETIHVQFLERFDLAYSSNCEKEYVEVRDGGTELSPSVGKYCYSMPPPQVLSEGNALFIKYYTNVEFPNNGFKAKISLARCGGTYHSFSYDDIKSPDYPKAYERDLNCVWHFIADDTELFTFEFLKLNLGEFKGHYKNNPCNSSIADSLTITGTSKGSNIVNTYLLCGENITVPEPILANDVIVNFTSVSSSIYTQKFTKTAKLGFHLTLMATKPSCSEVIELSHGEIQTPKYPSIPTTQFCSWRITVPPGRRVTLNVSDFEVVDTLTRFSVALWVYNDFLYTSLLARWNHSVPSGTTISSSGNEMMIYIFHLNGSSRRGFRGYFSSEKRSLCQTNELANTNGEIQVDMTQPYYCQWTVQPKKTNMSTTAFTIVGNLGEHFESGLCRRLRFYYEEMLGSRFCGVAERKSPFTFITPYLSTIIKAFTAIDDDGAVSNVSYSISWKNNECGGVFDSNLDVVRIASPTTSDGKYPANSDCVWILSYPEETALKITFNSLDLEIADSEKDCGDYLAIHGGLRPSSPRLLKVCGAVLPSDIITKSNSLWIQFHSDDSHELKGFDLTISVAHEACGGLFHGTYGTFSSENHPQQYRNNSNCIYEMLAPIGYIIQLTFADRFYIEESSDCSKDYVEVIDYVKHEWKTVGKFCGRSLPKPINSTSNRLRVRFKSDETTEGDGFFARWTVGCGGTFDAREPGVIHSPGYPDTYTHNLICNYTFTAPDNNKLLYGIFEDFELEKRSAAGCDTDTVDIYVRRYPYRTIKSLKLDGTYCGNSAPPKIQSFGMFTVIFRSDSWQEFKGFRLKYGLEECGGNITEPTVIQIPKAERFPLSFRSLLQECRWNVTAPVGQIVVIKVQQILLSTVGQCSQDFVKIWDGGYAAANNSNLLATLCGQTNGREALYRTSSEKAFIRFFSRNYFTFKAFAAEVSFMHGPKVGCGGFINLGEDKETVIKNPDLDKDGKYDDLMECLWTISVPRDLTVSATFQTLDIDNCTNPGNKMCHCDYVEIYDGMDENFERIGKYCGSSLPETVRSSRSYMAIKFSSDGLTNRAGFKIAVKGVQSPCGVRFLNVTENWQTLTSPSYPNNYPPDTHCSWLLMGGYGYMVIHIEEVDIEDSVACSKDSLKIRDFRFSGRFTNGSPENPSQKIYLGIQNEQNMNPTIFQGSKFSYSTSMFCGKRKGMDYYSSTNNVLIKFKSSSAQTSKGFKLKYSLLGCSRNFTFPQGRYKITNNRKNCITTIVAPNPNSTISLYFSELIIFSWTFNPNRDAVLKVYDGLNVKNPNALLASLVGSGRRTPDPIFSNSSQVTLVISPVSSSISFDITYTTTTAGRGCGGSIFNYGGVFTSPMYPMNLRNYTSCRWDVSVPHGNAIELQFTEFDLGPKQTCASDYVQIYDVDPSDGSESLQTTYCGNDSPAKYIGMKGQIAVKYVTSIHNGGRGWVARFMSRAIDSSMPAFTTMHLIN